MFNIKEITRRDNEKLYVGEFTRSSTYNTRSTSHFEWTVNEDFRGIVVSNGDVLVLKKTDDSGRLNNASLIFYSCSLINKDGEEYNELASDTDTDYNIKEENFFFNLFKDDPKFRGFMRKYVCVKEAENIKKTMHESCGPLIQGGILKRLRAKNRR